MLSMFCTQLNIWFRISLTNEFLRVFASPFAGTVVDLFRIEVAPSPAPQMFQCGTCCTVALLSMVSAEWNCRRGVISPISRHRCGMEAQQGSGEVDQSSGDEDEYQLVGEGQIQPPHSADAPPAPSPHADVERGDPEEEAVSDVHSSALGAIDALMSLAEAIDAAKPIATSSEESLKKSMSVVPSPAEPSSGSLKRKRDGSSGEEETLSDSNVKSEDEDPLSRQRRPSRPSNAEQSPVRMNKQPELETRKSLTDFSILDGQLPSNNCSRHVTIAYKIYYRQLDSKSSSIGIGVSNESFHIDPKAEAIRLKERTEWLKLHQQQQYSHEIPISSGMIPQEISAGQMTSLNHFGHLQQLQAVAAAQQAFTANNPSEMQMFAHQQLPYHSNHLLSIQNAVVLQSNPTQQVASMNFPSEPHGTPNHPSIGSIGSKTSAFETQRSSLIPNDVDQVSSRIDSVANSAKDLNSSRPVQAEQIHQASAVAATPAGLVASSSTSSTSPIDQPKQTAAKASTPVSSNISSSGMPLVSQVTVSGHSHPYQQHLNPSMTQMPPSISSTNVAPSMDLSSAQNQASISAAQRFLPQQYVLAAPGHQGIGMMPAAFFPQAGAYPGMGLAAAYMPNGSFEQQQYLSFNPQQLMAMSGQFMPMAGGSTAGSVNGTHLNSITSEGPHGSSSSSEMMQSSSTMSSAQSFGMQMPQGFPGMLPMSGMLPAHYMINQGPPGAAIMGGYFPQAFYPQPGMIAPQLYQMPSASLPGNYGIPTAPAQVNSAPQFMPSAHSSHSQQQQQ